MKNFFKGLLAGIGNITPGISGSLMLIIFNLYEECLNKISNIFKDFKNSFIFLFPIGLGILTGTYLFSNIIYFFINIYPMGTSIVFFGFLIGTLPSLFKNALKNGFNEKYLIGFFICFSIGLFLLFINKNFSINLNINFITLLFIGFLLCLSTIIPGISSTIILSLISFYNTYLYSINNIDLSILIPIAIGYIISFYFISKLMSYLFKNYYGFVYFSILGFFISTIGSVLKLNLYFNLELIISLFMAVISFLLTLKLTNVEK